MLSFPIGQFLTHSIYPIAVGLALSARTAATSTDNQQPATNKQMAWSLITEAAVLDELNNAELEKYREIVADDQPDPLPGIISRVTDLVRAYVEKKIQKDKVPARR